MEKLFPELQQLPSKLVCVCMQLIVVNPVITKKTFYADILNTMVWSLCCLIRTFQFSVNCITVQQKEATCPPSPLTSPLVCSVLWLDVLPVAGGRRLSAFGCQNGCVGLALVNQTGSGELTWPSFTGACIFFELGLCTAELCDVISGLNITGPWTALFPTVSPLGVNVFHWN